MTKDITKFRKAVKASLTVEPQDQELDEILSKHLQEIKAGHDGKLAQAIESLIKKSQLQLLKEVEKSVMGEIIKCDRCEAEADEGDKTCWSCDHDVFMVEEAPAQTKQTKEEDTKL